MFLQNDDKTCSCVVNKKQPGTYICSFQRLLQHCHHLLLVRHLINTLWPAAKTRPVSYWFCILDQNIIEPEFNSSLFSVTTVTDRYSVAVDHTVRFCQGASVVFAYYFSTHGRALVFFSELLPAAALSFWGLTG